MTDVFVVTLADNSVHTMVKEIDYFRVLLAMKSLVTDQRAALRKSDKKAIINCKARERALLDMVSQYEAWREQYANKKEMP